MKSVVCLLALVVLLAGSPAQAADTPLIPTFPEQVLGDPKAPVRIDEFALFTCPHCAEFAKDTLPKLKAEYIDTGKVKLVLHDLVTDQIALKASVLAHCVPPERYPGVAETLFRTQEQWVQPTEAKSVAALRQMFKFAGLTDDKIDSCLADKALEAAVLKVTLDATKAWNIQGTPTFVFDQDPNLTLRGTKTYDEFRQRIESRLKK